LKRRDRKACDNQRRVACVHARRSTAPARARARVAVAVTIVVVVVVVVVSSARWRSVHARRALFRYYTPLATK
jgi:hypothetical protein